VSEGGREGGKEGGTDGGYGRLLSRSKIGKEKAEAILAV